MDTMRHYTIRRGLKAFCAQAVGWPLALALAASVVMLAAAGPAAASYPGRAGAIAFHEEYHNSNYDGNGNVDYEYFLESVRPPGRHVGTSVFCHGINQADCTSVFCHGINQADFPGYGADFSGYGVQYCALSEDGGPSFSPDGLDLAFSGAEFDNNGVRTPIDGCAPGGAGRVACGTPTNEAIVLAGAHGGSPRLVPVAIADAEQPAFMPDGTTLIFAGKTGPGVPFDLYTASIQGTGLKRLTAGGASEPAPCANGSVVYVHQGDLYLRGADGRTHRLTRRGGSLPDCSRDSRTIAFVRGGALYTIYATGRRPRRLTRRHLVNGSSQVVNGRPAFSPAGGLIAVTTTTYTRGCASFDGYIIPRLKLIDLRGRERRSYYIGLGNCPYGGLGFLGATAWQPLPRS